MTAPGSRFSRTCPGRKTHIPSAPHTQVRNCCIGEGIPPPGIPSWGLGTRPPSPHETGRTQTGVGSGIRTWAHSEEEAASLPEASPQGQQVNPGPGPGGTVRHPREVAAQRPRTNPTDGPAVLVGCALVDAAEHASPAGGGVVAQAVFRAPRSQARIPTKIVRGPS